MNWKPLLVLLGVLAVVAMLFSQGFALSLFTDANIDRQKAQQWLIENEGEIVQYLKDSNFPKPTTKNEEIYELKIKDGDTKLKGKIDWIEERITILDEHNLEDPDLTVKMNEGTYKKAIDRFRGAVEDGEELGSFWMYVEMALTTEFDVTDSSDINDSAYKSKVMTWFNEEDENLKETYNEEKDDLEGTGVIEAEVIEWI